MTLRERAFDVAAHIFTDVLPDHGEHDGWAEEKEKAAMLILAEMVQERKESKAREAALAAAIENHLKHSDCTARAVLASALATTPATPSRERSMGRLTPCEFCGKTDCKQCAALGPAKGEAT